MDNTTPRKVAEMIGVGAVLAGAEVTHSTADERGRYGVMFITMPDGAVAKVTIELMD